MSSDDLDELAEWIARRLEYHRLRVLQADALGTPRWTRRLQRRLNTLARETPTTERSAHATYWAAIERLQTVAPAVLERLPPEPDDIGRPTLAVVGWLAAVARELEHLRPTGGPRNREIAEYVDALRAQGHTWAETARLTRAKYAPDDTAPLRVLVARYRSAWRIHRGDRRK